MKNMTYQDDLPIGTGKYYKATNEKTGAVKGTININDNIAREIDLESGQDVVISWSQEKREICVKPLTY